MSGMPSPGPKLVAADFAVVKLILNQAAKNDFKFKDIVLSVAIRELMTHR